MTEPSPATVPPDFDPRLLAELYNRGDHDALSAKFLKILEYFQEHRCFSIDEQGMYYINAFVKNFLYLFTQVDYLIGAQFRKDFIRHNLTISNLVAASCFQSTDPFLELLRGQQDNFVKILTLYSARNQVQFDRGLLFQTDADLTSSWYSVYSEISQTGFLRPMMRDNLRTHFEFQDSRLDPRGSLSDIYYGCTYVDGKCDQVIKAAVNRFIQDTAGERGKLITNPTPRRLAVLSAYWWPGHSVYRNYYEYVKHITGYHMTFFQLGKCENPDLSLFQEVKQLDFDENGIMDVAALAGDYCAAYFPDVGMSTQSIWLANLRIAPIQLCSPGHSVSTWGSNIDYFISGRDVEVQRNPERNYSERLVLLPGCGVIHNYPLHTPRGRKKSSPDLVINCPWSAQKVTYEFVGVLRQLLARSRRKVLLRLFVGWSLNRQNHYLPFVQDIHELLGPANVEVYPNLPYSDYMSLMEEGDFSIDSYHFGGCNSVADSLYVRKLMVTWDGDKWYNRIGSQMMRIVGLPELAASSEMHYLDVILKLIHDESYRDQLQERLNRADLDQTIFSKADAPYFQKALDYLIANHPDLQQDPVRSAIRIPR